jgi:hypothetical protein
MLGNIAQPMPDHLPSQLLFGTRAAQTPPTRPRRARQWPQRSERAHTWLKQLRPGDLVHIATDPGRFLRARVIRLAEYSDLPHPLRIEVIPLALVGDDWLNDWPDSAAARFWYQQRRYYQALIADEVRLPVHPQRVFESPVFHDPDPRDWIALENCSEVKPSSNNLNKL